MTGPVIRLSVNGAPRTCRPGRTLDRLVAEVLPAGVPPRGVAVAVGDAVVPRGAWAATVLADGDRVEVLTAVQGG
jgi:sulfur carrier protein